MRITLKKPPQSKVFICHRNTRVVREFRDVPTVCRLITWLLTYYFPVFVFGLRYGNRRSLKYRMEKVNVFHSNTLCAMNVRTYIYNIKSTDIINVQFSRVCYFIIFVTILTLGKHICASKSLSPLQPLAYRTIALPLNNNLKLVPADIF